MPLARAKDPGAKMAGPIPGQDYTIPEMSLREPPSTAIHCNTSKFLVSEPRWPWAEKPKSCIDLSGYDEGEFIVMQALLLICAKARPGDFVRLANRFPRDREGAYEFFTVAGFSDADAVRLTQEMPTLEELIAEEEMDQPAEEMDSSLLMQS